MEFKSNKTNENTQIKHNYLKTLLRAVPLLKSCVLICKMCFPEFEMQFKNTVEICHSCSMLISLIALKETFIKSHMQMIQ